MCLTNCSIVLSLSILSLTRSLALDVVMEMCGGSMTDLSTLELMKRDDLQFEVVDESDYDDNDDDDDTILDELEELDSLEDDEEDSYL